MSVFADATVICTHRDPVAVAKSMSTMLTYTARMSRNPATIRDVGLYWIDRMQRMFRAMADERELVPSEQSIDVKFHEFMADDIATVQTIYELADHPWSAQTEAAMANYMALHPRGVHGSVSYHVEKTSVSTSANLLPICSSTLIASACRPRVEPQSAQRVALVDEGLQRG